MTVVICTFDFAQPFSSLLSPGIPTMFFISYICIYYNYFTNNILFTYMASNNAIGGSLLF